MPPTLPLSPPDPGQPPIPAHFTNPEAIFARHPQTRQSSCHYDSPGNPGNRQCIRPEIIPEPTTKLHICLLKKPAPDRPAVYPNSPVCLRFSQSSPGQIPPTALPAPPHSLPTVPGAKTAGQILLNSAIFLFPVVSTSLSNPTFPQFFGPPSISNRPLPSRNLYPEYSTHWVNLF